MKDLLFICRYVEPFRSYEFPIDGRSANFVAIWVFFPAKFFWGRKLKFRNVPFFPPQREFGVKISWRSVEGRKFTAG